MFRVVEFAAEDGVFDGGFIYQIYLASQQELQFVNEVKEGDEQVLNLIVVKDHREVYVAVVVETGGED